MSPERIETIRVLRAEAAAAGDTPLGDALRSMADTLERRPGAAPVHAPLQPSPSASSMPLGVGLERSLPRGDRDEDVLSLFDSQARLELGPGADG